ncbi:MAG: SpoIID/LytB domain-containing protein [Planctomycetes bacterium]|nr:SpoIID/LytB domain-containing protein [Planctomycetota bacterium]
MTRFRYYHALGMVCALSVCGVKCRHTTRAPSEFEYPVSPIVAVRDVRVLLVRGGDPCRLRIDGPFVVHSPSQGAPVHFERSDWAVLQAVPDRRILLEDRFLGRGQVTIVPRQSGTIWLTRRGRGGWRRPRRYAGTLIVTVDHSGRLNVINSLDVETYVACVVSSEIYPDFHREAYRAQAVASRTYVLYQMAQHPHRAYDVLATEASQVYGGLQNSGAAQRARQAVNDTRAVVATWRAPQGERIFCTYYSSCCGGMTQDVANSNRDEVDVPPLAGGVRCEYCKIAPAQTYRWKPVRLSKREITTRLVARYPEMKDLHRLERLEVVRRTKSGRPTRFRLVGSNGRTRSIIAEDFRLAVGSRVLRSTDFKIDHERNSILFTDGHGFGHGMGLCQWGMQGMALKGHRAPEILKFYYPSMHLTRAY